MRQLSYVFAVLATGSGFALMTAAGCFPFGDESGGGGGTTTSMGSTGAGAPCSSTSLCKDDGNPCTKDECKNGFCVGTPLTMASAPGSTECTTIVCNNGDPMQVTHEGAACGTEFKLKCNAQGGCSGCMNADQCGKNDECQKSICQPDMTCKYEYTPIATKVINATLPTDMPGDCMATVCNGTGALLLFVDDTDVPDDHVDCTDGQCANGVRVQAAAAAGTPCTGGATFCNASKDCVPCATDANCGMEKKCYQETECVSCDDGDKNGDETDLNCGGSCKPCLDKQACAQNKDCMNMRCENGKCISCGDGVKNGSEVAIDCGGPLCPHCPGDTCSVGTECSQKFCSDNVCCDTACEGVCKACNVATKVGICSDAPVGFGDPVCPVNTPVCQSGACVADGGKAHFGAPCVANDDCFSMKCQGMPKFCK